MNILTTKEQNTCIYSGLFGALLCATCLIQHLLMTWYHWIAYVMLGIYAFAILCFILLGLLKTVAPWLLIVASVLLLFSEILLIFSRVFSLIVLLTFIYSIVIVIVLFMEGIPAKLKEKARAHKAEEWAWKDKL